MKIQEETNRINVGIKIIERCMDESKWVVNAHKDEYRAQLLSAKIHLLKALDELNKF